MPDSTVEILGQIIDLSDPCAVAMQLQKVQLKLATGGLATTVRFDREEVTFQNASDSRLEALLQKYQAACVAKSSGKTARRKRFAKRVTYI